MSTKIEGYRNVRFTNIAGRKYYLGRITHKRATYTKCYNTPEEAAKFVDRICIQLGIPQKNNTFKQLK